MYEWNSRKKTSGRQWNRLLDVVIKILKYNKSTLDHSIYIKLFTYGTVIYLRVSTDNIIDTTNNETSFHEPTILKKKSFEMKLQEGSVRKYLKFRTCQYPLGFSVDQNDHIMELVNEFSLTGKFRIFYTLFCTESSYEKGLSAELPLTGYALHNAEI